MPVTLTLRPTLVTIRFHGLLVTEDAAEVVHRFDELPETRERLPLLVDATDTFVPYFHWTEERRRILSDVAARVGPIGIAATSESARAGAKNAFDPLSTTVVWRMFDGIAETTKWLALVAEHGRSLWSAEPPNPTSVQLARLLHSASIRRASA